VSTDFLALRLFCFNIRQHGRQILYFKLYVDGRKFHYQRPQVVHSCVKSCRLHNWYNCPSKPFATSHACFSLRKSRKSHTMLTALTLTAKSTSAAYCTSPTRDVQVRGLVVRPITATIRVCFQWCVTRSLNRCNCIRPHMGAPSHCLCEGCSFFEIVLALENSAETA